MQIFVRNLSGQSLAFDIDPSSSLSSLHADIEERTGVPSAEQRLLYAGRQLADGPAWESAYGVEKGSTLQLALRLRGGAKKRCQYKMGEPDRCNKAAMNLTGECGQCERLFCGTHRIPEMHSCPGMDLIRAAAKSANKEKLEREATTTRENLHNISTA